MRLVWETTTGVCVALVTIGATFSLGQGLTALPQMSTQGYSYLGNQP